MPQPSQLPNQIRIPKLLGLNERVSPAQLELGQFAVLEGLYPSKNGLLARPPGKAILATLPGNVDVLNIWQTYNINGDILVQTDAGRVVFTLDELYSRSTIPNLTPGTTPGTNDNEEAMSYALIVQKEAAGTPGGSLQGYLSGTDSSSAANTFYGRRLTDMLVNQSSTVVSFTASTGGSGAVSTPGTFTLAPGTYRIRAALCYSSPTAASSVVAGLYNNTTSQFEVQAGTSVPIMGTPQVMTAAVETTTLTLFGRFTVTGANSTYQINQECSVAASAGRALQFAGATPGVTGTNVNGATLQPIYAQIEILKEP